MRPWRVPYPKFGDGPGLERVSAVARRLGVDLAAFGQNGAVIIGSNGKGSTAAMTAALLQQGLNAVGLFTSPHLLDLISPHALVERDWSPAQARAQMSMDLWLETMCLLLRLFPGNGNHSYCKSFGDVSPLALETVFDRPIQELETLILRLRSALVPSLAANEEITGVLLQQLARE